MDFIQKGYNNLHARWKVLIEHGEEENIFLQRSKEEATELMDKINFAQENLGQMLEAIMMKLLKNEPVFAVAASVGTSQTNEERAVDEAKEDGNANGYSIMEEEKIRLLVAQELKVIQNDHENVLGRLKVLTEREESKNVRGSMAQILLQQQNLSQSLKDLILKLENEEATATGCVAGPSGTYQTDKEEGALKRVVNDDDDDDDGVAKDKDNNGGFLNQMKMMQKGHDDLHKRMKNLMEQENLFPTDDDDVKEIHLVQESLILMFREFIIKLEHYSVFHADCGDDYLEMDDLDEPDCGDDYLEMDDFDDSSSTT